MTTPYEILRQQSLQKKHSLLPSSRDFATPALHSLATQIMMAGTHGSKQIVLPGLSRPFSLGMLYDIRSDKLFPGLTLWNKETLEKNVLAQAQQTSDFKIIAEDTIESKSNALDIGAGLKLSFMGGLISVSGAAKYLNDRKSSNRQSRVTARYKCTTEFKQLSMNHLGKGNVQHPDVFGHATHVVTGVLYGAQAFFVFDKYMSDEEMKKNIESELHAVVKILPSIKTDGDADLKMSDDEKKVVDKLEVQFYGDFRLPANPTSFTDAVKLYKDLPNLLGPNQENAVPVKVWLYPLEYLDSKSARLVREISANLVSQTEECIEQFHTLIARCKDLGNSLACKTFQGIRGRLSKFRDMVNNYKDAFTMQLTPVLPKIRSGGAEESELLQVIQNKERSPFNHRHLVRWLNNCEEQIRVMERYISSIQSVKFASNPGDLSAAIMDPAYRYCVCFNFQLITEDRLQSAMEAYLKTCNEAASESDAVSISDGASLWDRLNSDMAENWRHFMAFLTANANRSSTTFIVAEDTMITDTPGAFIHLYNNGKLVNNDFKPPSKPGEPREEHSSHDELELSWEPPDVGTDNITHYSVSYRTFGSDEWTVTDTNDSCPKLTILKLVPTTSYKIMVTAECEAGISSDSDIAVITTRPTNPPVKPKVAQVSVLLIRIEWAMPTVIGNTVTIETYDIERSVTDTDGECTSWNQCGYTDGNTHNCEISQEFSTQYRYRVIANCGERRSLPSDASEVITINASKVSILKERVRTDSKMVGNSRNPSLFQVPLKYVTADRANWVRKISFGKLKPGVPEKVILIVGATGAGKTTFINGIMNYVLGVEWKDDFRFKLVEEDVSSNQALSQTQWISAYTLYHEEGFQIPYTLTIIDTPGFGDTTGITRDKKITEQLRHFFSSTGDGGIDHIDAIGFVTQASLPRLTPSQKYIFDSILSLFGKDIAKNIFLLITFGDGQNPPVLAGVKEAELPYEKFFKFNNSALFATNRHSGSTVSGNDNDDDDDEDGQFDMMFWKMGVTSYKKFLKQLDIIESQSLSLTKSVLEERNRLELVVVGIQSQIQKGLNKLEQLKTEVGVLKTHKADIERNKSFTYTVKEDRVIKINIPTGHYTTNCIQCNFTCHYPCGIPNDANKSGCWAMSSGNCRICPRKCDWTMHHNLQYRFETEQQTVTKTSDDLKTRYESAKGKSMSAEKLIENVFEDFTAVQMDVLSKTNEVRKLINHLKEIALKPNPLSAVDYIDILIESEKSVARPGWKERVAHLTEVRKEAEALAQFAKDGYDPFEKYHEIVAEAVKTAGDDEQGVHGQTSGTQRTPSWLRKAATYLKNFKL